MSNPQAICNVVLHHYGIATAQNGLSNLFADPNQQTVWSVQNNSTPNNPVIQTRNLPGPFGNFEAFNIEGNLASVHPFNTGESSDPGVLTFAIKSAIGLP
jgi:hypothetical protein